MIDSLRNAGSFATVESDSGPFAAQYILGLELEQPGPAVRPFEGATPRPVEVGTLGCDACRRKVRVEPLHDRRRLGQAAMQSQHSHQQPVHVHGRVPVVAAVKRRMHFARRQVAVRRCQKVIELARIFAHHVGERDARKTAGEFGCQRAHLDTRQPKLTAERRRRS